MSNRIRMNFQISRPPSAEDAAVLRRMASGDAAALRELYALYAGPLLSYAVRTLRSTEDAEEVLQDVFVKLWKKAPEYDAARSSPFTWAWMLMRGLCLDVLRRRGRRAIIHEGPSMDDPSVTTVLPSHEPELARREEYRRVLTAVAQLPAADRRAVEMAVFLEYTGEEIAGNLNQPLGTVKSRLRRGLLRLRQILQNHD